MNQNQCEIGIIGLGVMGFNLACNIADHGFSVAGFDKAIDKVQALQKQVDSGKIQATENLQTFVASLKTPKTILLMVPHGHAVDAVIEELTPLLQKDDIIMDGGNSNYKETHRRQKLLAEKGIYFLGIGISGGEEGARHGPCIMPGGPQMAYNHVSPILEAISAKVEGKPCVTYLGPGSAGHYVKMVHNGIEYAVMQLIAETYDLMKTSLNLSDEALHFIFEEWNQGILNGFLIEITADIFTHPDDGSGRHLVDMILDIAEQNGTGLWTSQDAMALGIPTPTIDASVMMRNMSTLKQERQQASQLFSDHPPYLQAKTDLLNQTQKALYFGMLLAYAQGFELLKKASDVYGYRLDLEQVALIWRGGCIIRAEMLNKIAATYQKNPNLSNPILNADLAKAILQHESDARDIIKAAVLACVPAPALMASLAYYDAYRRCWLPANLIQAQRDFFGAHKYKRIDKEGLFHTQWR